jgi:hypothetical protein
MVYPDHPISINNGNKIILCRPGNCDNYEIVNGKLTIDNLVQGNEYHIIFPKTVNDNGLRDFINFFDHDCDSTNKGWYLDTVGEQDPNGLLYTFTMFDRDRTITAYYKAFTRIEEPRAMGLYVMGKLLDEFGQKIINVPYHPTCTPEGEATLRANNREVTVYYQDNDNKWNQCYPGTDESSVEDGSWLYNLKINEISKRLNMEYIPNSDNWYYYPTNPMSAQILIGDITHDGKADILDITRCCSNNRRVIVKEVVYPVMHETPRAVCSLTIPLEVAIHV